MRENKVVKLRDVISTKIQNGYSPLCQEDSSGVWVLSLGALTGYSFDSSQIKAVSSSKKMPEEYRLKDNDILVSRSNTLDKVGRCGVFHGEIDNCFYPDLMMRFRADEKIVLTKYLETVLQSEFARKYFQERAAGTSVSMMKINKKILEDFSFSLPSLKEQEKIIKITLVWDSAIEKTEKLISEKERMFSFLMKKILSKKGNTCYLNKIVTVKKGKQLNKENMISNGTVPVLNGGISYSGFTNFANTQKNTIAISEGGNSCGYVNFVSEDFWAGGHCYTLELKDKDVETKFLYWMLKSKEREIMNLRVGSGLPNIQQNDLCNLKIEIYNKNDQLKIIEVLDCQQRELSLLKKQLEQYKLQKQGLMQKLLTGEWRVK